MRLTKWAIWLAAIASAAMGGAGVSLAADLARPVPAPPPVYKAPPPLPVFTWTGIYIGANIGGAWDSVSVSDTFGNSFSTSNNNGVFVGGGQVGGNYQINNLVLGVEGDFDWAAHNNSTTSGLLLTETTNDRWITTITGRLGVAWDRVLFYGKGGGAWVGNNGFTVTNPATGAFVTGSSSTASGWTAGGGIEWAFAGNWTARAEYDYIGLSSQTLIVPATSAFLPGDNVTFSHHINMFTVGINYLFGPGNSVVARY